MSANSSADADLSLSSIESPPPSLRRCGGGPKPTSIYPLNPALPGVTCRSSVPVMCVCVCVPPPSPNVPLFDCLTLSLPPASPMRLTMAPAEDEWKPAAQDLASQWSERAR